MFATARFGDPSGLSPGELVDRFHELEALRREVDAALAATVGEADRSGAFRVDGHASVTGWCRALGRWSDTEATHCRRVADLAAASEVFRDAVASGAIGVAQADQLARTHANPRCGPELVDDIDQFVAKADRVPYRELRDRLSWWVMIHDVDGAHRDRDYTHHHRDASLNMFDGAITGAFRGGAADGVTMTEIFERFCDAEFTLDWDTTVTRHGDDACAALMPRTTAQRRFDALRAIFERAVDQPADTAAAGAPLVNIVVDIHTLDHLVHGAPTLPDHLRPDVWTQRCSTVDGTPLTPDDILTALWWGKIRTVVCDTDGTVRSIGGSRRLFTGKLRDAVMLHAETCTYAGCAIPTHRCQADHLTSHSRGGPTTTHNGAPVCGRHNRFKHTARYQVTRAPDHTWHTTRPDGTELR